MESYNLYNDIAQRTQGEIYVGVVGPVRTGKSTFIKRFMDTMVLPNLSGSYKRERINDEIPQAGAGKMIMTTQPNFVPNEAVELNFGDESTAKVRLIDCVGYFVEGATGHMEDGSPRMVRTPWYDYDIPFNEAAEIGTRKVISEHSTIGIVVTTDGSITEIPRSSYIPSEERVVRELKELGKPFIIVLNSAAPQNEDTRLLRESLESRYQVPVILMDVMHADSQSMEMLIKNVLYEFPIKEVWLSVPDWMLALSDSHWLIKDFCASGMAAADKMLKMRDYDLMLQSLSQQDYLETPALAQIQLGEGSVDISVSPRKDLFYKILGDECGYPIEGDYHLVSIIKELVDSKKRYDRVKDALDSVKTTGYGLVQPSMDELELDEPEIVHQGSRFGVKLRASAPSLHMIRVDIETEVSPIMGSERQSEELLNYLLSEFESNPSAIWNTNIFGKSLHDLVREGLANKLTRMPEEIQSENADDAAESHK